MLERLTRHPRVVRARARFGERRHRQLYPLRDRVAALEGRPSGTVLWQEFDRPPLPPLPPAHAQLAPEDVPAALDRLDAGGASMRALRALGEDRVRAALADDRAPIPAPEDRTHYFAGDDASYWLSGLADAALVAEVAERQDVALGAHLDFGCGSGRVLRHLHRVAPRAEGFGVDVSTGALEWARTHLPPELRFVQGTLVPALPFADASFDTVYAGSVFTHIGAFEEAWLLELGRVLRPGGLALLSIHPERTWDAIGTGEAGFLRSLVSHARHRADPPGVEPVTDELFRAAMPAGRVVVANVEWPINNLLTFHTEAWVRERWGRDLVVEEIVPQGHGRWQDLVVLRAR